MPESLSRKFEQYACEVHDLELSVRKACPEWPDQDAAHIFMQANHKRDTPLSYAYFSGLGEDFPGLNGFRQPDRLPRIHESSPCVTVDAVLRPPDTALAETLEFGPRLIVLLGSIGNEAAYMDGRIKEHIRNGQNGKWFLVRPAGFGMETSHGREDGYFPMTKNGLQYGIRKEDLTGYMFRTDVLIVRLPNVSQSGQLERFIRQHKYPNHSLRFVVVTPEVRPFSIFSWHYRHGKSPEQIHTFMEETFGEIAAIARRPDPVDAVIGIRPSSDSHVQAADALVSLITRFQEASQPRI